MESLPFWDVTEQLPCMYAGTFKSSLTEDHHLFYWFFRNLKNSTAPLLVWLNGGPGSSSMFGLFLENGPLRVNKLGEGEFKVNLNSGGSWLESANLLYID